MEVFALKLDEIRMRDLALVGGKAAHLGDLIAAGFPVPKGICVTTDAFRAGIQPFEDGLKSILSGLAGAGHENREALNHAVERVEALLSDLAIPTRIVESLHLLGEQTGLFEAPVSVRSSATGEDQADVSFAGQFDTVLGVSGEGAVLDAILTCWRSFFGANALVARTRAGDFEDLNDTGAMAVVVQRMIDAEGAGVSFTVDPLEPQSGLIVTNAAWGLGIGVVDGTVPVDTVWVDRARFDVTKRRSVGKGTQVRMIASGGVQEAPVADERREAPVLPDAWAKRIAQYTFAAEQRFGLPQDVEWAVADQRVWILQSRPITGIQHSQDHQDPFPVEWQDVAEARSFWQLEGGGGRDLALPLEHDVRDAGVAARADAALITGRRSGAARPTVARSKVINGRRYTRHIPIEIKEGDELARSRTAAHLGERLRAQGITPWEYAAPEVIAATERLAAFDRDEANGAALATHFEDSFGVFRHHWTLHWVYGQGRDAFAAPFNEAFESISGLSGSEAKDAAMPLLEGTDNEFTKFLDDVYELAVCARKTPAVVRLIEEPVSDVGVMERLQSLGSAAESFLSELNEFLKRWGQRSGAGYGSRTSITLPTLQEEPSPLITLLVPYVVGNAESPSVVRARAHRERERRIEELLQECKDARAIATFRRWLPLMRRVRADLENHNHYIDQLALGQLRTAVMAAARWLVEQDALRACDEIFWLHRDEITGALRSDPCGLLDGEPMQERIRRRRAQYEEWKELDPPAILGVPLGELPARPKPNREASTDAQKAAGTEVLHDESLLQGEPASAGRRSGRARLVSMSERLPNLDPGDVLVAENAGPLWTPLFPILAGVVLDQGVLFQHAATTAREYGLPAVLQTRDGTKRIREGDWVTVDGNRGTVEIHETKLDDVEEIS